MKKGLKSTRVVLVVVNCRNVGWLFLGQLNKRESRKGNWKLFLFRFPSAFSYSLSSLKSSKTSFYALFLSSNRIQIAFHDETARETSVHVIQYSMRINIAYQKLLWGFQVRKSNDTSTRKSSCFCSKCILTFVFRLIAFIPFIRYKVLTVLCL